MGIRPIVMLTLMIMWEMTLMSRKICTVLLLTLLAGSPVFAQQWARKMFKQTSHDFGSVARGAKVEYDFVLSNIYVEDVHISSVRTSCGCTAARIEKPLLKTYQQGAIVASFNTRAFTGRKGATITVTFDKPRYAQTQLHVSGHIRTDVVLQPGSVQLGNVDQGSPTTQKIAVTYSGRQGWSIVEVKSANPHISATAVRRSRGGGRVVYDLTVHLDESMPTGYVRDHLMLITNDRYGKQIPVLVEGRVLSAVTVSPASLFLGVVHSGQKVTKQLVVRGKQPFRIVSVTCDDESFQFRTPASDEPKRLHLIPVTFVASGDSRKVNKTIRIETDLGDATPELSAYAVVAP